MTARRFLLPVFPNFHGRGEIEELLEDLGTRKLSWRAGSQVQTSRVLCIRQEYVRYAEWDALVPARGSDLKFEPTGDGEDDNDTHTVPFSALIDLDESCTRKLLRLVSLHMDNASWLGIYLESLPEPRIRGLRLDRLTLHTFPDYILLSTEAPDTTQAIEASLAADASAGDRMLMGAVLLPWQDSMHARLEQISLAPAIADGMRTTILSRAASIDVDDVEIDCRLDRDDRGALR